MVGKRSVPRPGHHHLVVMFFAIAVLIVALAAPAGAREAVPIPTMPATEQAGHQHDHGGPSGQAPTAEEQAAADQLVQETQVGTSRFADFSVAEAEGYRVVTPFAFYGARAAHFHNDAYAFDGRVLDPERPEDLIYLKQDDGDLVLLGVMFLAPIGQGPAVGGPLTHWHTHDDLCGSVAGLVPTTPAGECPEGTLSLGVEMLHVWLIDHPDGPFADVPPPSTVTVPLGPWVAGGSLTAGASLVDADAMSEAIATALGLHPLDVGKRMLDGESLAEIAADQDVPRDAVARAIQQRLALDYDRAVAAGDMTPDQRDLLLRTMPAMVERMIDIHAGEPWIIAG
jgi:hypothetical protein